MFAIGNYFSKGFDTLRHHHIVGKKINKECICNETKHAPRNRSGSQHDPLWASFLTFFFFLPWFVFITGAAEDKDPLCINLFYQAGEVLGRHVTAVVQHMDDVSLMKFKF